MKNLLAVIAALTLCSLSTSALAADSPQFRGPNRDGVFPEQGLLKQWPETGPQAAWVAKGLGQGFSSAAVANGKIYVSGMQDNQSGCVSELNLDGTLARTIPFGKETVEEQAPGTRSTPTIDENRLYLMSGLGVVYCLDLNTGQKVWEANILERFAAKNVMWHMAESLLIDGDRVICTPGGSDATLAALNKMTGETLWTTKGLVDKASYCTPVIVNHNGHRVLLTETGRYILGVNPDTGALLWSFEHKVPWDIHGVSPVYSNGLVYYTGGDGVGGGALEMAPDATSVTVKWLDNTLDCLHHGVVLVDGHLYGTGYKGGGKLVCLEMATGKVMWTSKEVREGAVVAADGMLYVYEGPKAGVINLVKASPAGFERTGKVAITEGSGKHWAHPTIANGMLYIRHGDTLIAYNLTGK